jgi:hypothetical protein
MEPGDTVIGESYRVYAPMGLQEVIPSNITKAINDPKPAISPVTIRASVDEEKKVVSLSIVDDVLPTDYLKFNTSEDLKRSILDDIEMTEGDIIILDDDDIYVEPIEDVSKDVNAHKCNEPGCDKTFASKRGLKSHKRIHKD